MKNNYNYKKASLFITFIGALLLASCGSEKNNEAERFKSGVFEIPAGKGYSKTTITKISETGRVERLRQNGWWTHPISGWSMFYPFYREP